MTVKDIIDSMREFPGNEVLVVVKPAGTKREYYNSNTNLRYLMDKEVENAEVRSWFVCGMRRDKCTVVIIVDRNEEYEASLDERWKELTAR